ncbi:MlaD family protein [Actinomadura opuntiae]|uniref:MlaD family protein n=1 Tax=Actinomadura sp. OS1-43 TaxID=604315 RepID=UPI00255B21C3|nr:MlaD family protein [Actinomadura sp. OS1-43]MDL4818443.1 MlaD family protein [Actinomadura sp. OS1-43]
MSRADLRRVRNAALAASLAAATLGGCGLGGFSGVQDLPLPGGADLGDHPYTVKAQFANVLNLVPQSAVKVNDVAVGRVVKVSLPDGGWTAEVTMKINGAVRLPAGAYAQLAQSSLLGEKFVQLSAAPQDTGLPGGAAAPGGAAPGGPAPSASTGRLADGAVIPVSRTNRNPEVEEVFGALSMLLNGGGIAQLRTITTEMNKALDGNEPQIRSLLEQARRLVGDLDANRQGITDALDGVNRLSATLRARQGQIGVALDDIEPGLKVLEEQRGALVRMLDSLNELSGVAVTTVRRSQDDLVADLKALEPTLRKLSDAGHDLPNALQVLLTYPFTDAVLPAVKGDYLNVYLQVTAQPGTQIVPPIAPLPAAGDGKAGDGKPGGGGSTGGGSTGQGG